MAGPTILLLGTLDTKLEEFVYLHEQIRRFDSSVNIKLLDVGRTASNHALISIPQSEVLANCSKKDVDVSKLPRGEVINTMIEGATETVKKLYRQNTIHAAISAGGSGNTSLAAAIMRDALPVGFPKLIVSTVASGETSMYVGETDLTLMYSVVDVAGLNAVLKGVLSNAAAAIGGMARAYKASLDGPAQGNEEKPGIGITMFGVTTSAVDTARAKLTAHGFEVFVFHATGAGGRAMERLIREGRITAVLDLTTTELADELVGGVFSAGPDRLTAAAKAGIPQVVSVGALDMVNFGPKDTVPVQFKGRTLLEHNPSVTLMRTNANESRELGRRIGQRLWDNCSRPGLTEVVLPLKGVSVISTQGQAFYDKRSDEALFGEIKSTLAESGINVIEEDRDINDKAFAEGLADRLMDLIDHQSKVEVATWLDAYGSFVE